MTHASKSRLFSALTLTMCLGPCTLSAETSDPPTVETRTTKPVKKTLDGNKIIDKTIHASAANSNGASAGMALVSDGNGGAEWSSINYNDLANAPANLATTTYVDAQIASTNASLANTNAALAGANATIATLVAQLKLFDPNNCGGTGIVCSNSHVVVPVCSGGVCTSPCVNGYADCNGNKQTDGCETNLTSDLSNCGACGHACPSANGTPSCTTGACSIVCNPNFTNCNGSCVNRQTDASNCGTCGNACPSPPSNGSATCSSGTCGITCNTNFVVCNGFNCVNTSNDTSNCGSCGHVCPTGASCTAGVCTCPTGQSNCTTLCANLSNDTSNCGTCGHVCPTGATCASGVCTCPTGDVLCGTTCANLSNDPAHCGNCATVCPMGHACSNGVCQ
ncbi:MAG TPA: hypothetical protein VKV04_09930 [Verrucomicrobiae bacterium]|nr:hypothetical protein [Verrucomicrobiae bacterium]